VLDTAHGVGHDWVWLRLHQQSAVAIKDKAAAKLAPQFYGSFQVGKSLLHPPTYEGWNTSPPTYENGFLPPQLSKTGQNHPLKQF
jgi:hypothetical protein